MEALGFPGWEDGETLRTVRPGSGLINQLGTMVLGATLTGQRVSQTILRERKAVLTSGMSISGIQCMVYGMMHPAALKHLLFARKVKNTWTQNI